MTNNDFLRRLRYALNIKDNTMVQIFKKGNIIVTREDVINYLKKDIDEGIEISEGELSALFRSEDHKNYKECGDKYVRVFLKGLIEYYRN